MATQQDLQELLRLLTGARKLSMMQAMGHVKALQAVNLRSIKQIAEAPLDTVETAIQDAKAARTLQNACKAAVKRGESGSAGGKRPNTATSESSASKRTKSGAVADLMLGPTQMTPQELEASLALPVTMDEDLIAQTVILTNRAPVVLAFAVELLRYTMPEQPLSSRLSLAQAVVSANSRSKAVSIGLQKGASADDEGWGEGQPRVKVMGREIAVLKRGGYEWKGEEEVGGTAGATEAIESTPTPTETQRSVTEASTSQQQQQQQQAGTSWTASHPISLRDSTFIARAAVLTDPSQRQVLIRSLMDANPSLKTATHNAWAYRIRPPAAGGHSSSSSTTIREDSFDDGETGCGDLMLKVMRDVSAVDTIVVLTRWFGGTLLGPDRWRLMRNCVTSALAERLRKTGTEVVLGGEAVWGLDLEGMRGKSHTGGYGSGIRHHETAVVGMQIHRPEAARNYLLKSFAAAAAAAAAAPESSSSSSSLPSGAALHEGGGAAASDEDATTAKAKSPTAAAAAPPKKKQTLKAQDAEKAENLGLLLGALRLVYDSWADHLTGAELDRRAWGWYVAVRPDVEGGPSGWGAKGALKLRDILNLRRKGL